MADRLSDRPFATEFIRPMAGIRTGGTANRPAIRTRGSLGLFPDDRRTGELPLPQIGSGAYSRLAATQQPSPYVDAIMRRARGMGGLPTGGGLPTPPPAPKSPSLMDRLTPAMGTPAQAGLASAAATGLQLSGYRPVPITTAEGLGAMMQAGMKSYNEAKAAEAAAKRADLADRIAMAELGLKSKKSPELVTLYTEGGGSYKARYDPSDPSADKYGYVMVGGIKPPSGMSITTDPETGAITFSQGIGAGMEKTTKKGLEEQVLSLSGRIAQLDSIAQNFDPSFLQIPTQLEMAGYQFGERLNWLEIPEDIKTKMLAYSDFRARTQEVFSAVLKELSGAAVTKFELANAETFMPSKNDSPSMFEGKLRGFRATSNAALYRAQNLLSGEDKITDNLAKKYPLSITRETEDGGRRTIYIDEYVNLAMGMNKGLTQSQALTEYAREADIARKKAANVQ